MKDKMMAARGPDRLILIAGAVLVIALFLPWFKASGIAGASANGIHEFDGILALLLGLAVTALAAVRVTGANVSIGNVKDNVLFLALGGGAAVFAIIRFLRKPSGLGIVSISWGFGAFIGLAAAIVLAIGSVQKYKATS
jgi:hypothetical protein